MGTSISIASLSSLPLFEVQVVLSDPKQEEGMGEWESRKSGGKEYSIRQGLSTLAT